MEIMDLIQTGNKALEKASQRWEPERGFRFSTFAIAVIERDIKNTIRDFGREIAVPGHVQTQFSRLNRIEKYLTIKLNREPTFLEIANEIEIQFPSFFGEMKSVKPKDRLPTIIRKVRNLKETGLNISTVSLNDAPRDISDDNNGAEIIDYKDPSEGVEDQLVRKQEREIIREAIESLRGRDKLVYKLVEGLDEEGEPRTYDQVGKIIGVTRQRAEQIYKRAKETLKTYLLEKMKI